MFEIPDDPDVRAGHDADHRARTRSRAAWRRATADWYAITLRGVGEVRAILDLLRDGVDGEVAEEPSRATSAGAMPAGSLLFDAADADVARGRRPRFRRVLRDASSTRTKPAETTQLDEAPRVAMLAGGSGGNDTLWSLEQIFGSRRRDRHDGLAS